MAVTTKGSTKGKKVYEKPMIEELSADEIPEEIKAELDKMEEEGPILETRTSIPKINPFPEHIEYDDVLIFKANKPLTPGEFKTLGDLLRREQQELGIKVMLVPFSADLRR